MNAETQHTTFIKTRLIMGLAALMVSLFYSWKFIAGDASGSALAVAVVFVLVTEISKVLFMSDALFYGAVGQTEKAAWTWAIVCTLFVLSISATAYNIIIGSSQTLHTERLSDEQYQAILQRREDNNTALADAKADRAACPANYLTKCINPAQKRIDAHTAKQAAIAAELQAFVPVSGSNAFWGPLGGTGAMLTFAFIRGVLLEIIGIILLGQALAQIRVSPIKQGADNDSRIAYTQCVTDGCDNTFLPRTTWQKYCAECREERASPHKGKINTGAKS